MILTENQYIGRFKGDDDVTMTLFRPQQWTWINLLHFPPKKVVRGVFKQFLGADSEDHDDFG